MTGTATSSSQNGQSAQTGRGIGGLFHDLLFLGELQGQLLVHDMHTLWQGSTIALSMMLLSLVLGFASLPVAFLGLSWLLSESMLWPLWACLLGVSGVAGLLPAVVIFGIGMRKLRRRATVLTRSTSELRENAQWLKRRLKQTFS